MGRLHDLHATGGQSPWLDNLRRDWILDGELARWIDRGVRGLTSNPAIFQKAITGAEIYDEQFAALVADGADIETAYWDLVAADIEGALDLLRPVHEASDGMDGFVSVEVAPGLARDTAGTLEAARALHTRLAAPNLYIKIPGTAEGLAAITAALSEGISVNVTLLFGIDRYREVMDAYISGLEAHDGPLHGVSSVASFFVSRVDAAVDAQLDAIGTPEAEALRGRAAVANAQLAYHAFTETFRGERWDRLVARGARVQRPLWASTSTKNPAYPSTLYVDTLIAPDTVNTMPESTLEAFEAHGTVARTADADLHQAIDVLHRLADIGIDLDSVTERLEDEGVTSFVDAFDGLLASLAAKAAELRGDS